MGWPLSFNGALCLPLPPFEPHQVVVLLLFSIIILGPQTRGGWLTFCKREILFSFCNCRLQCYTDKFVTILINSFISLCTYAYKSNLLVLLCQNLSLIWKCWMPPPCAKYDPVVFRRFACESLTLNSLLFDLRAPSSTDVPVLLLNQPIMYGLTCKFSVLYNADLFTSSRNPNFLENGTDKISLHVKVRKLSKLERSRKRTTRMTSNKIQRTVMNSSSAYWSLHSTISIVALLQPHYTGFCLSETCYKKKHWSDITKHKVAVDLGGGGTRTRHWDTLNQKDTQNAGY